MLLGGCQHPGRKHALEGCLGTVITAVLDGSIPVFLHELVDWLKEVCLQPNQLVDRRQLLLGGFGR